jgi:hypothetical protein
MIRSIINFPLNGETILPVKKQILENLRPKRDNKKVADTQLKEAAGVGEKTSALLSESRKLLLKNH